MHLRVVVGKTIMRLVAENNSVNLSEQLTFKEIANITNIVDGPNTHYGFINSNATVEDVSEMFQRSKKRKVRLDVLFITDNGQSDGLLQGMVTPVDLL